MRGSDTLVGHRMVKNRSDGPKRMPEESFLQEYRRHARPVIIDGLIFLTVLAMLFAGFGLLKAMEAAGYNKEFAEWLERVHFMGSFLVIVLFAYDMLMKVTAIVFGGHHES